MPELGSTASAALGGRLAVAAPTTTLAVALAVAPPLSVTVTLSVQEPAAYVCCADGEDCGPAVAPSPNSNR